MSNVIPKAAELIFQLGRLQCYWHPTEEDKIANTMPREVYYQDAVSKHVFGPFEGIYMAMHHYATVVHGQKHFEGKKDADMIYVDFNRRKRIEFGLP